MDVHLLASCRPRHHELAIINASPSHHPPHAHRRSHVRLPVIYVTVATTCLVERRVLYSVGYVRRARDAL